MSFKIGTVCLWFAVSTHVLCLCFPVKKTSTDVEVNFIFFLHAGIVPDGYLALFWNLQSVALQRNCLELVNNQGVLVLWNISQDIKLVLKFRNCRPHSLLFEWMKTSFKLIQVSYQCCFRPQCHFLSISVLSILRY